MYKWDAEEYQKSSSAQQKWAGELINKMGLDGIGSCFRYRMWRR